LSAAAACADCKRCGGRNGSCRKPVPRTILLRAMRPNRLRQLLQADRPSLGTHIHITYPGVVELIGHSGMFDYVEFVGEYAPYDLYTLENLGRAVELFPHLSAMMKIEQEPRTYLAIRAIGSGIQNVLFADPRTVADIEACVKAVRAEAPHSGGWHGVGMRRDVGYVLECGSPAFVQALDDAVVAVMIEKASAVENLDAILAVKGVDMVQFGPADYAMSIGLAGQWSHPRVREAERFVIESALKKGIAPRAEISRPEDARRYLDLGVKHFCMGWDVGILFNWYKEAGSALRTLLGRNDAAGKDSAGYGTGGVGQP
ncbi:MAG: aldolase/citrate lyase family protein, partial [Gemmataceae bacterium]|nr:aldolase/citrate lyase family protein [Gemmataceae bacterium]